MAVARRRAWRSRPRAVAAGAVVAVALAVVVFAFTPAGARLAGLADRGARLVAPPGWTSWRVATRVLAAHPLTGVGPEGYRIAFGAHVDAAYERHHGRDPLPDRAHSGPLDVALAGGPLGLAAWTALLLLIGRGVWRSLRNGPPWLVGAAAGLVAHWAGQLFLFPLAELEPIAWLLAGVVLVGSARPDDLRRFDVPRVAPIALGFAALVALAVGGLSVGAVCRAEVAATHLGHGASAARTAEWAAEDAVPLRPDVVRTHLLLARTRLEAGRGYQAALVEVDRASRRSPGDPVVRLTRAGATSWSGRRPPRCPRTPRRPGRRRSSCWTRIRRGDAWWLRGRAAALAGRTTDAEGSLRRAASLAPHEPGPLLDLALLQAAQGRGDEARAPPWTRPKHARPTTPGWSPPGGRWPGPGDETTAGAR